MPTMDRDNNELAKLEKRRKKLLGLFEPLPVDAERAVEKKDLLKAKALFGSIKAEKSYESGGSHNPTTCTIGRYTTSRVSALFGMDLFTGALKGETRE